MELTVTAIMFSQSYVSKEHMHDADLKFLSYQEVTNLLSLINTAHSK